MRPIAVIPTAEALRLAARAVLKARAHRGELRAVWDDLRALVRLVRAWARGRYRRVPWRAIAVASGALLYFVNPFDAVPDFVPALGLVDDASVVALVVASLRGELRRFAAWEGGTVEPS
jgi:uncharacterized membrane protein YkvA (DUF1232 family)